MPIDPKLYTEADVAFNEQITLELQKATAILNRIATLLRAGLADPQLLKEFRTSVDRVREVGWIVQQSLDAPQEVSGLLFARRAWAAISLLKQLREDLEVVKQNSEVPMYDLVAAAAGFIDSARGLGLLKRMKD